MGRDVDLEQFRVGKKRPTKKRDSKSPRQSQPFIRGPIPLEWMARAANIPRRNALVVALVLWWLAGMTRDKSALVFCASRCKPFGLGRKAVERGLRDLENAKLIHVERSVGKCARVDLLTNRE